MPSDLEPSAIYNLRLRTMTNPAVYAFEYPVIMTDRLAGNGHYVIGFVFLRLTPDGSIDGRAIDCVFNGNGMLILDNSNHQILPGAGDDIEAGYIAGKIKQHDIPALLDELTPKLLSEISN